MSFISIKESNKRVITIAVSHLIQAIFIVIKIKFLTNFFSISAYAQFAILLSSMSTSVALARGGIDFLLTKKLMRGQSRPDFLPSYLSRLITIVGFIIFLSVLFQVLMYIFFLNSINKSSIVLVVCISFIILNASNVALLAIYKGLDKINIYAKSYLIGSIVNSISQCLLVWAFGDSGIFLVIIGGVAIQLFIQCLLFRTISKKYNLKIFKNIKVIKISYLKSGTFIALAKSYTAGVGMMSQFILIFSLNYFSKDLSAAAYYLYTGLIGQASNLILIAVSGAFFPTLLRAFQKGISDFYYQIYTQSRTINIVIFPLYFFLLVFQEQLILIIANDDFILDTNLFTYLLCASFLAVSKQSFELSLYCHQSNKYFLVLTTISNALIIFIPILMLYFYGIEGFGIGLIVHAMLVYIMVLLTSAKVYKYSLNNFNVLYVLFYVLSFLLFSLNVELLSMNFIIIVLMLSILNCIYELFYSKEKMS